MKKTVCMVLALLIFLITAIALAENSKINFVYGLDFGISSDEAILKTGFAKTIISDAAKKSYQARGINGNVYFYGNAKVASYDVFTTCYTDEEDKICQIVYSFKDASEKQYQEVEASLAKYGTTHYTGGKPINKSDDLARMKMYQNFDRVIPYGDGSVIIEHFLYYNAMTSSTVHLLSYSYVDVLIANNDTYNADL